MNERTRNLGLTAYDDLFSTDKSRAELTQEKVTELAISEIDDFPEHPFQVKQDDAMAEMVESVKKFGIITPAVVRPKKDGRYELISGHRRKKACELAGFTKIPAIVREMDRDEAIIFMVDSNLQREKILPSERAYSYKMRLEAMKRQGQRNDLTSTPVVSKLRSNEQVGEKNGDSREQVRRYIRLTRLIPNILQMVDNGKISFRPAVEISYLSKENQQNLYDIMEYDTMGKAATTPSLAQATKMKEFSKNNQLTKEVIFAIMQEEKPNQKEQLKLPKERISKYFPEGTPQKKMEDIIVQALELYRRRQRDRER